jgi:hypothetical protein
MNRLITIVALMTLGLPLCAKAQSSPQRPPTAGNAPAQTPGFPAAMIGHWRSRPAEVLLSTDIDRDVYGPNAVSSRVADVVIAASGEGTLTVNRRIVNRRGQTVPGTRSIEEVQFVVGAPDPNYAGLPRSPGKIVKAERRYLDPPVTRVALEGGGVEFYRSDEGKKDELLMHFDTPDGQGSFSETLTRQVAPRRSATE